ncbi:MAG TPA: matrixin family metalloprotease [Acidimicrobiales bacterium]
MAIHYVVNLSDAPPTAASDVAGAIARLSQATGITFVDDGATTEMPSQERAAVQSSRYGPGWAPLLIAWTRPAESDYLPGGNVVGEGGNVWTTGPGGADVYVTGQVAINTDATRALPAGFGPGTTVGLLLLHELGHAVGLAHVSDPNQVMYPDMVPRSSADYGDGDRRGLTLVGRGSACVAEPSA